MDNFESNSVMHCFCVSYDETSWKQGEGGNPTAVGSTIGSWETPKIVMNDQTAQESNIKGANFCLFFSSTSELQPFGNSTLNEFLHDDLLF